MLASSGYSLPLVIGLGCAVALGIARASGN